MPEEEKEELVLIYQAKGLDEAQARALADRLMADKDTALDTLAREELGIDPEELGGSAWAAAGVVVRAVRGRRDLSGGAVLLARAAPPRSLASLAPSGVALDR